MFTKFDVRSSRVKGISFHKQRSWILCGLHNGMVEIWDYRMNMSVESFNEHSGSVRGVDFHSSQPIFVTGADDATVKVWNYKLRRCLYTLTGHLDYVRTTFFHHEQPWIVSCSDDYTIRIWNWQNRKSVACLPGHSHFVMCAQFHPQEDLIVSASLDKTIRVWDISLLRSHRQETTLAHDLLKTNDVIVKSVLEEHERGVNWVAFHPTKSYFISGSDDRTVGIWKLTKTACYLEASLRGHTNNVCCVAFFKDLIISNSEDHTIRVWDSKQHQQLMVFRRDSDRYWILAIDPENNLIAAGHDSGLQVFKILNERIPFLIENGAHPSMLYVYDNTLHRYEFESGTCNSVYLPPRLHLPRTISINPADKQLALWFKNRSDNYGFTETFFVSNSGIVSEGNVFRHQDVMGSVFVGPNKLAYADRRGKLCLFNVQTKQEKVLDTTFHVHRVFPGLTGSILCQSENRVLLYHMAQHTHVAEATVSEVRHVVWNKNFRKVALLSSNSIVVMTNNLKLITTVVEPSVRVKSAVFDETRDVLFFTTSNHLKYLNIGTGETSTINSLRQTVYLCKAVGNKIWHLTRGGKVVLLEQELVELDFKMKLQQQAYRDVLQIIRKGAMPGQALVGYLHKHGHADIALHLVSDPLTRFHLAIDCAAMDVAREAAMGLREPALWRRLAATALTLGDLHLAQHAYAQAGDLAAQAQLALLTGNSPLLRRLLETAEDPHLRLHYGLALGDVATRVEAFVRAGRLPLAYAVAKAEGMDDLAAALLARVGPAVAARLAGLAVGAPRPPPPLPPPAATANWPTLRVEEPPVARLLREPAGPDDRGLLPGEGWPDDDDEAEAERDTPGVDRDEGGAGAAEEGWDDDLELAPGGETAGKGGSGSGGVVVPRPAPGPASRWGAAATAPAVHVAAGAFAEALQLLRRQIGLVEAGPLKPHAMRVWAVVRMRRPGLRTPASGFVLTAPAKDDAALAPRLPDELPALTQRMEVGLKGFLDGKFAEALGVFQGVLHQAVFAPARGEEWRGVVRNAAEYARALALQIALRGVDPSSSEGLEMALHLTHAKLRRAHLTLILAQAMTRAYKRGNFHTAARVAQRLLELEPPANKVNQARAIIAEADKHPTDALAIGYNERNPFTMCCVSHRAIYKGTGNVVQCGYCASSAAEAYRGRVCPICKIAEFGADCSGLQNRI